MEKKRYYGYRTRSTAPMSATTTSPSSSTRSSSLSTVRLFVDGERVDDEHLFYGDKTLEGPSATARP